MKANCPQCSTVLTVDDAKVPDRAFSLKCPKCQTLVRVPGKAGAVPSAPAPAAAAAPPAPRAVATSAAPEGTAALGPPPPAEPLPNAGTPKAPVPPAPGIERVGTALVALARPNEAAAMTPVLARLGYGVEYATDLEESHRRLDHGTYAILVTDWAAAPSLYGLVTQLLPETRRSLFLMIVGDPFKTGDGTQAWLSLSDLVVRRADLGTCDQVLRRTLAERERLFKPLLEVQEREMSAYR